MIGTGVSGRQRLGAHRPIPLARRHLLSDQFSDHGGQDVFAVVHILKAARLAPQYVAQTPAVNLVR